MLGEGAPETSPDQVLQCVREQHPSERRSALTALGDGLQQCSERGTRQIRVTLYYRSFIMAGDFTLKAVLPKFHQH